MEIKIKRSNKPDKKFMVTIDNKTIHFGSKPNKDFTIYSQESKEIADKKKKAYIARHSKLNENWNKSGIKSAGFWSKHILWNKPTLRESIKDTEKRFNIKINNNKNIYY
jgi:hypothetical protein